MVPTVVFETLFEIRNQSVGGAWPGAVKTEQTIKTKSSIKTNLLANINKLREKKNDVQALCLLCFGFRHFGR
jgi:hypothetical protein